MLAPLLLAAAVFITPSGGVAAFEKARDEMRASGKPGTITLRRGIYFVDHSIGFDGRDPAGSTYTAEAGARLVGGVRLRDWKPVTDPAILSRLSPDARRNVRVHSVASLGAFSARGFGRPHSSAHSELFFNGQRMTVARWPNHEFTRIAAASDPEPPDDGHGKRLGRITYGFRYEGDRPSKWQPSKDIWVHGYWAWDWADTYERVDSIDTAAKAIVTAPPHGLYGFRENQRYYFLNVLEELDEPGEFFLDGTNGRIYFWPPANAKSAEIFLSTLDAPVLHIRNARGLTFDGFSMEAARATGLRIENSEGIELKSVRLRNIGNTGVIVEGGRNNTIKACEIAYTGDSAIEITGGERATLTPGNHRVEDCDVHHMGEWVRTYNPAVKINGVGNFVVHNHIHDAPHAGILITGNDHMIEYNNIHHLAMETGDVGAIYIGRDYTERGTVIRYNYIHELGGVGYGSMGVYIDDCASGTTVYGNVFYKLKFGAFVGGGRDNRVENNVFIECKPAIHLDARGLDQRPVWQKMVYEIMKPKVLAPGPFIERYPELKTLLPYLEKTGGVPPEGNVIRRNLIFGEAYDIRKEAKPFLTEFGDNAMLNTRDGFDPVTGAYTVPTGAPHTPIPVRNIKKAIH